jgi:mannose-6-phosphate isomerase-like protein (cupin superfamily)
MINNSKILKLVKDQHLDYSRYESGELKVIGHPDHRHSDYCVNEFHSYIEWVKDYQKYPVIKVEGIENIKKIKDAFDLPVDNIHLFVSQNFGISFNWHRDDVNVFLYVLKGQKRLWVRDKQYIINARQGVLIPKGHLHRVRSKKGTVALSVGYR